MILFSEGAKDMFTLAFNAKYEKVEFKLWILLFHEFFKATVSLQIKNLKKNVSLLNLGLRSVLHLRRTETFMFSVPAIKPIVKSSY